jgi:hypothetical protein
MLLWKIALSQSTTYWRLVVHMAWLVVPGWAHMPFVAHLKHWREVFERKARTMTSNANYLWKFMWSLEMLMVSEVVLHAYA